MGLNPVQPKQDATLLDTIYGAVSDPGRWQEVLTKVADHLGAVGGMLIHIPTPGNGDVIATYGRLSEEYGALVRNQYAWNPWSMVMRHVPGNRAIVVNSFLEPGEILKSAFYADVLRPQGIVDILNFKHDRLSMNGGVGGFGFCLSARGSEHANKSLPRLQSLVPHLNRALEGTLHLSRLADGTRQLARVLQLMPNPGLLLDSRGRVILANPAAEALLRANDGLSINRHRGLQLVASFRTEAAALSKALAEALDVAAGTDSALGEPLRVTRPSGAPPLLILPIPLPPPAFELWSLMESARVLVLVIDPVARRLGDMSWVQAAYGLTPAESRVAILVASGLTGSQIADTVGVSLSTVKTQLKQCFEKTGVHSQVGLARLFGALPIESASEPNRYEASAAAISGREKQPPRTRWRRARRRRQRRITTPAG